MHVGCVRPSQFLYTQYREASTEEQPSQPEAARKKQPSQPEAAHKRKKQSSKAEAARKKAASLATPEGYTRAVMLAARTQRTHDLQKLLERRERHAQELESV